MTLVTNIPNIMTPNIIPNITASLMSGVLMERKVKFAMVAVILGFMAAACSPQLMVSLADLLGTENLEQFHECFP